MYLIDLLVTIVKKKKKKTMAQIEMGNLYASYIKGNKKKRVRWKMTAYHTRRGKKKSVGLLECGMKLKRKKPNRHIRSLAWGVRLIWGRSYVHGVWECRWAKRGGGESRGNIKIPATTLHSAWSRT
jgi:hypothetical protein